MIIDFFKHILPHINPNFNGNGKIIKKIKNKKYQIMLDNWKRICYNSMVSKKDTVKCVPLAQLDRATAF